MNKMKLNIEQITAIAAQLAGVAAVLNPNNAAAISTLFNIGRDLSATIRRIRDEAAGDPILWNQITREFASALQGFEASMIDDANKPIFPEPVVASNVPEVENRRVLRPENR